MYSRVRRKTGVIFVRPTSTRTAASSTPNFISFRIQRHRKSEYLLVNLHQDNSIRPQSR